MGETPLEDDHNNDPQIPNFIQEMVRRLPSDSSGDQDPLKNQESSIEVPEEGKSSEPSETPNIVHVGHGGPYKKGGHNENPVHALPDQYATDPIREDHSSIDETDPGSNDEE